MTVVTVIVVLAALAPLGLASSGRVLEQWEQPHRNASAVASSSPE